MGFVRVLDLEVDNIKVRILWLLMLEWIEVRSFVCFCMEFMLFCVCWNFCCIYLREKLIIFIF